MAGRSLLLIATTVLVASCSETLTPPPEPPVVKASFSAAVDDSDFIPVLRTGRYTLIELAPASGQRDLMRQVVSLNIPDSRKATVGDALRQLLSRSGYKLCAGDDIPALSALPLPASHYRLGPLMLRDALLTLAGPAWDMTVDDATRTVCFARFHAPDFIPRVADDRTSSHKAAHVERRPLPAEARS